jgi:hypothetical protein
MKPLTEPMRQHRQQHRSTRHRDHRTEGEYLVHTAPTITPSSALSEPTEPG